MNFVLRNFLKQKKQSQKQQRIAQRNVINVKSGNAVWLR